MRIVQVILPGASEYERKSQRIDLAGLAGEHDVRVLTMEDARRSDAQLVHVYGEQPPRELVGFALPYVASFGVTRKRWALRQPAAPRAVVSPLPADERHAQLQEAVDDSYFAPRAVPRAESPIRTVGSFGPRRAGVKNMIEQTISRIHRFRQDVRWHLFETTPTVEDLQNVDLWVDPATVATDLDGFVAEALAAGTAVVAARSAINSLRLEKGRTGFLVPMGDPNETTHAILSALFKPEVAQPRETAARQTASKFRARSRIRQLSNLYESLIPSK